MRINSIPWRFKILESMAKMSLKKESDDTKKHKCFEFRDESLSSMKLCINCKYCRDLCEEGIEPTCRFDNEFISPVTGKLIYHHMTCMDRRQPWGRCGKNAEYYEEKK